MLLLLWCVITWTICVFARQTPKKKPRNKWETIEWKESALTKCWNWWNNNKTNKSDCRRVSVCTCKRQKSFINSLDNSMKKWKKFCKFSPKKQSPRIFVFCNSPTVLQSNLPLCIAKNPRFFSLTSRRHIRKEKRKKLGVRGGNERNTENSMCWCTV